MLLSSENAATVDGRTRISRISQEHMTSGPSSIRWSRFDSLCAVCESCVDKAKRLRRWLTF